MTTLSFGVNVSTSAGPGSNPVEDARRAEALGFDFVSANDHPAGTRPSYETWTMLAWIAAKTTRIRIASRVLGVPYRAPAMVAKMAETLQRLSEGRLILGLGAGYSDEEFRAFGLRTASARAKIEGLEEAVTIMRGLWTSPGFTFEGRHHQTHAADLEPKPDIPIPVWLGTYGPRALAVTGRVADGWIPTFSMAPPGDIPAMWANIQAGASATGRDPAAIERVYNLDFRIDGDERPGVVTGTPSEVAERLGGFVELGFRTMNLCPAGSAPGEQIERMASEVLPLVRAAA